MTYTVSLDRSARRRSTGFIALVAGLGQKRDDHRERRRTWRTQLALSEEARIHAQMNYRRTRIAAR